MHCPVCSYNLTGTEGHTCPECGSTLAVIAAQPDKLPTRLLYVGVGFILLFCIAQTVWFWRDHSLITGLLDAGGQPDPGRMAADARMIMWARYAANMSLGLGLCCITIALFQVFRRAAQVRVQAPK